MVRHTQTFVANAARIEITVFTMRACLQLGMIPKSGYNGKFYRTKRAVQHSWVYWLSRSRLISPEYVILQRRTKSQDVYVRRL